MPNMLRPISTLDIAVNWVKIYIGQTVLLLVLVYLMATQNFYLLPVNLSLVALAVCVALALEELGLEQR